MKKKRFVGVSVICGGEIPLHSCFLLRFTQIENIHSESAHIQTKQFVCMLRFRISLYPPVNIMHQPLKVWCIMLMRRWVYSRSMSSLNYTFADYIRYAH